MMTASRKVEWSFTVFNTEKATAIEKMLVSGEIVKRLVSISEEQEKGQFR